ncbi:MAG: PKD domain-containing protein, partial [Candidatus Cloacimonetes bacterium]|nr:PKD domain-containing protein [Candidatus Cloacimonadota bacterium]
MGAFYFDPSELFANFTAIPTFGTLPLEVQFIDLSRGNIINWQWDFQSDGIIDSYEQNPTFTYDQEGIYSVKLIVQDTTKADTLIKEDYITVNAPITIDGFAYLENQSNHSGIKVLFERTAPSSLFDSTFTDNDGYFSIDLEIGVYNITYSKDGYFLEHLYDQQLFSNTTLPDVTLLEYVTILNVPYAFSTIQLAIDYAFDGNIVLVQPGTYVENINFIGKNITVGSLFLTTGDSTYISQTIIDGNQNGHVVTFNSGEDSTALLIGFTITNGYSSGSVPENNGGGIFCYSSNPCIEYVNINGNIAHYGSGGGISIQISNAVLNNVTICNNTAQGTIYGYGGGGGIFCGYDSNPILTDVIITGNTAITGGGIKFSSADVPILNNVSITGNTATNSGGGIFCYYSNPSFNNVIINENTATNAGGGFRCQSSPNPNLTNVLISCNNASNGGGFYSSSSGPSLTNVTISGNNANNNGGGIYSALNTITSIVLINSIVSYNTGNYGMYNDPDDPGILSISYSDFWDNEEGNFYNCGDSVGINTTTNANGDSCDIYYNIQLDPLFIDPENGDYHLTEGSPCIDAGDPNSPP